MYRSIGRLLCCLFFWGSNACAQASPGKDLSQRKAADRWADSVYARLPEAERIGQLFMVAAYSGGPKLNQDTIEDLIRHHQIGGLIFMQGGPARQAALTNRYQQMARVPLLIGMDAEWGLGMRLDSVTNFPRQMMLGATDDTALAYAMGMAVAYQCKRLGVHINFAPVVDVNNNPDNPVINARSFGEDKKRVSRMAIAYMRGMQDFGVMACAKHFPGHGDTNVDSHKDLPVVSKTLAQLDTLELYPFKKLIAAGVQSMMVAHLAIPALEQEAHVPTTLSHNTVTTLLRQDMGFSGLIFTDALNMQGVAKYFEPGEVDLRAFKAGNDVLLFSQNVPLAIRKIGAALKADPALGRSLEARVKKILRAKYTAGLAHFQPIDATHITDDINQYTAALNGKIAKAAVTRIRGCEVAYHWHEGYDSIMYIAVNGALKPGVESHWKEEAHYKSLSMPKGATNAAGIMSQITDNMGAVIVGVHNLSFYPSNNYGLEEAQLKFINEAGRKDNVIIVLMGNPYAVKYLCDVRNLIVAYEDNEWTQEAVFQFIARDPKLSGKLPVTPPCLK